MEYSRDAYVNRLVERRENGLINIMNLEKISTRVIKNDDNLNNENVKKLIKKIK